MCKRTIQHYMHHDARIPMTLDINGSHDGPLYAHPLRTLLHTCDVDIGRDIKSTIGSVDDGSEPETPRQCKYHSCCICRVVVEMCPYASLPRQSMHHTQPLNLAPSTSHANEYGGMPKPEECAGFTLEHRHQPLNTLKLTWCQWARARSNAVAELPSLLTVTLVAAATERRQPPPEQPLWRDLQEVVPQQHWRPVYRRAFDMYIEWSAWMFDYMAQLVTFREEDACALAELQRLGVAGGFAAVDRAATTAANVRALEEFLHTGLKWAASPPP